MGEAAMVSIREFEDHELWQVEDRVKKQLEAAAGSVEGKGFENVETLDNIRLVLADVRSVRSLPSWRISSMAPLDALEKALTYMEEELTQLSDNATEHRPDLPAYLGELVDALKPFPLYLVQSEAAMELEEALRGHREFLDSTVRWLDGSVSEQSEAVETLKETIAGEQTKIAEQVKRLDEALNNQNNTFMTRVGEWKKESDEAAASIVSRGEERLMKLSELEEKSRNLVDATSRHTITAEYGNYAKDQERAAFWWSAGAVTAAIGGFVYLSFVLTGIHDASVAETIIKATISSLVVLGAGFMSRESSGHRKEARDARRTQLDLNALDPFLTKLEEGEANDLRREFAQKIFGRPLANDKSRKPYEWAMEKLRPERQTAADDSAALDA
ncbi:hypothetical protein [Arthrobacter koreensis]|uniref:hypothetical protein n=1 Tax=Arthrobacter koreensis TaxID=199136 RepID=UPI002DBBCD73|nr:hypothetical protein [Arthrobacter koreensis]MEB7448776.1 hypothetical protein [Arthrobacter koreensis]